MTVFHNYRIGYHRALFNHYATEKYAVFNLSRDIAAVRDERILDLRPLSVKGGHRVFDLGEDLAVAIEQIVSYRRIEDPHALRIIGLDVVDDRRVALHVIAIYRQRIRLLLNDVLLEVEIASLVGVGDQVDQQIFLDEIDVETNFRLFLNATPKQLAAMEKDEELRKICIQGAEALHQMSLMSPSEASFLKSGLKGIMTAAPKAGARGTINLAR